MTYSAGLLITHSIRCLSVSLSLSICLSVCVRQAHSTSV